MLKEEADNFIAAGGHFGKKSRNLVKNYAQDLGFEYLSAANKDEFSDKYERFLSKNISNRPIVFEIFTEEEDENNALKMITNVAETAQGKAKEVTKRIVGKKNIQAIKKMLKK